MRRLLASALLAPALLISSACVGESDKGEEDDPLTDSKADSFRTPTEHGTLTFGEPAWAEFTAAQGFHSWTFELSGDASVDLTTGALTEHSVVTPNLDTVMYLYRRTSPTATWGSYIAKNDDEEDGSLRSRIIEDLGAGEYRVIVKTFKRSMRGEFHLGGTCTGAGCPPVEPEPTCEAPATLPAETGFGGSCAEDFASVFATGLIDVNNADSFTLTNRCDAEGLMRTAVDYYADYGADLTGELDPETELEVSIQAIGGAGTDGGYILGVTDGGDESAISFIFDSSENLVALYQHNQSPDVQFYCREASAPEVTLPNVEDCVSGFVSLPHEGERDAIGQTSNPASLAGELANPIRRYAASNNLSSGAVVSYEGASWNEWDAASRLTVTAAGKPATSYLSTSSLVLLEQREGAAPALVCE